MLALSGRSDSTEPQFNLLPEVPGAPTNRVTLTSRGTSWPNQFIENDDVTFEDCGARGAGLVSSYRGASRWLSESRPCRMC